MSEMVVPNGWITFSLDELGEVVGGGTPASSNLSFWNGEIPWATPAEITKLFGRYISKTNRTISRKGLEKSSAKLLQAGTILLTSRASIGFPAINTVPMATNQGFQSLKPNEKLDSEFGFQLLLNSRRGLVRLSAGSTFLEISSKEVKRFKVSVPPLPEQKKIASILTSVDDVIEKNQSQINKLQDLKKATMNELLTRGIGHTKFKDSAVGRIPKEWGVISMENAVIIPNGQVDPKVLPYSEMFHVGSGNIESWTGKIAKIKTAKQEGQISGKYQFSNKHILYSKVRPNLAKVCFPKFHGVCSADIYPLLCAEGMHTEFVFQFLLTEQFTFKAVVVSERTGMPKINRQDLSILCVSKPSLPEQQKIATILSSIDTHIDEKQRKLNQTKSLKKSLMQDLLTGKVRVTIN